MVGIFDNESPFDSFLAAVFTSEKKTNQLSFRFVRDYPLVAALAYKKEKSAHPAAGCHEKIIK